MIARFQRARLRRRVLRSIQLHKEVATLTSDTFHDEYHMQKVMRYAEGGSNSRRSCNLAVSGVVFVRWGVVVGATRFGVCTSSYRVEQRP